LEFDPLNELPNHLHSGEFAKARQVFESLLDKSPNDPRWITGFFISSFWDNRIELIQSYREGKDRAHKIMREYKEFEEELEKRDPVDSLFLTPTKLCVMEEASFQFAKSYEEGGIRNLGLEHFQEWILCLHEIGEPEKVLGLWKDSKNQISIPSYLNFFFAEALWKTNEYDKASLEYKRFWLNSDAVFPIGLTKNSVLYDAWNDGLERFPSTEKISYIYPSFVIANQYLPPSQWEENESEQAWVELERLSASLEKVHEQYVFKTTARVLFLSFLVREMFLQSNPNRAKKAETIIQGINPVFVQ
jgi:tetratricopeptide (TPR) repeat protein